MHRKYNQFMEKLDNCKDVIKLIENCLKDKFIVRALRKVKRTIKKSLPYFIAPHPKEKS